MNLYEEVEKIKASGYSEQKLKTALPAGAVFCQRLKPKLPCFPYFAIQPDT